MTILYVALGAGIGAILRYELTVLGKQFSRIVPYSTAIINSVGSLGIHIKLKVKLISRNGLRIIVGAFVYAIAINDFLIPHQIGEGGVTGLTTIGYYALHISPAYTNFVLNGLLMLVGFRFLEKRTVWYLAWAVLWMTNLQLKCNK